MGKEEEEEEVEEGEEEETEASFLIRCGVSSDITVRLWCTSAD